MSCFTTLVLAVLACLRSVGVPVPPIPRETYSPMATSLTFAPFSGCSAREHHLRAPKQSKRNAQERVTSRRSSFTCVCVPHDNGCRELELEVASHTRQVGAWHTKPSIAGFVMPCRAACKNRVYHPSSLVRHATVGV